MNILPRMPNPGEAITATWARELVRYIRAITPIAGRGTRLDLTPNGTRIHSSGGGSGGGGGGSSADNGCFRLVTAEDEYGDKYLTLADPFFCVGGLIKQVLAKDIPSIRPGFLVMDDPPEGSSYHYDDNPFVFLQVNVRQTSASSGTGALGYAKIDALPDLGLAGVECPVPRRDDGGASGEPETVLSRAKNPDFYVRPLYMLTHDGKIAVDYRNMPDLSALEF